MVLLVSVMLPLVCPRRRSLGLSLVVVAFSEAALVQVVSPLESVVLVASCLLSSALESRKRVPAGASVLCCVRKECLCGCYGIVP